MLVMDVLRFLSVQGEANDEEMVACLQLSDEEGEDLFLMLIYSIVSCPCTEAVTFETSVHVSSLVLDRTIWRVRFFAKASLLLEANKMDVVHA